MSRDQLVQKIQENNPQDTDHMVLSQAVQKIYRQQPEGHKGHPNRRL